MNGRQNEWWLWFIKLNPFFFFLFHSSQSSREDLDSPLFSFPISKVYHKWIPFFFMSVVIINSFFSFPFFFFFSNFKLIMVHFIFQCLSEFFFPSSKKKITKLMKFNPPPPGTQSKPYRGREKTIFHAVYSQ